MFHILVVEDDAKLRSLFCTVLTNNGYLALPAESGEKALSLLDSEYVDLIISDIMMSGMDGYELIDHLRTSGFTMPILIITAKERFEDKQRGFQAGTDDYMVKPIDVNEMVLRVGALLKRAPRARCAMATRSSCSPHTGMNRSAIESIVATSSTGTPKRLKGPVRLRNASMSCAALVVAVTRRLRSTISPMRTTIFAPPSRPSGETPRSPQRPQPPVPSKRSEFAAKITSKTSATGARLRAARDAPIPATCTAQSTPATAAASIHQEAIESTAAVHTNRRATFTRASNRCSAVAPAL